ncbi:MAG: FtsQ-type POTRA domain-containing protein [Spirochaetales bacterium]|nr:MAG: FtsQ-type POTRA domain-containing protein [Spirochaetales bacterium]
MFPETAPQGRRQPMTSTATPSSTGTEREKYVFRPVGISREKGAGTAPGYRARRYENTAKENYFTKKKAVPGQAGRQEQQPENRRESRPEKDSRKVTRKIFVIVISVLSFILVIELLFNFIFAPKLQVKKILIDAENPLMLSKEEIIGITGLGNQELYHNVNTEDVRAKLLKHPAVKDARVNKTFPDTVSLYIVPRIPLAVSLAETNSGYSIPLAFDEEGVVFQIGADVSDLKLPVVSGLRFADIRTGVVLPKELVSFLKDMKTIKTREPVLLEAISELKFIKKNEIDYEVLLFPEHYRLPVRIGRSIDAQQLKYMLMVLDVVSREGIIDRLKELDFRTADVVYTMKEE